MATVFKIKRGLKANLPSSAGEGEPLFCTDTGEFFIGKGSGNPLTRVSSDVTKDYVNTQLAEIENDINVLNSTTKKDYFKGLCVRNWQTGKFYEDQFRVYAVEKAQKINADTIQVIVNTYQPNEISNDPKTREPVLIQEIRDYITYLKGLGYRIFFKHHVELDVTPYVWRANINPSDVDLWFTNYTNMTVAYAQMCQELGVEIFSIGSEYRTLTSNYPNKWIEVINAVRNVYKGILTYGASNNTAYYDELDLITFWDKLDVIGIDYYIYPTENLTYTVDDIKENIYFDKDNAYSVTAIDKVQEKYQKPILIAEFGYSIGSSTDQDKLDYQANYTQAILDIFAGKKYTEGFFVWVVDPSYQGSTDSYLRDNTPIETVLAKNFIQKYYTNVLQQGIYLTPKNSSGSDKWSKIASINLQKVYSVTSCVLYFESLLANTGIAKKGQVFFRVGADSDLTTFRELKINSESTFSETDFGYKINGDIVDVYVKVSNYHQISYKPLILSPNNITLTIYDFQGLQTISDTIPATRESFVSSKYVVKEAENSTNATAGATGKWSLVADATITARYERKAGIITVLGGQTGDANVSIGRIYFRVKQQNPLESAPTVEIILLEGSKTFKKGDVTAVLIQNDATQTKVELYIKNNNTYETLFYKLVDAEPQKSVTLYNQQALLDALPAGTQYTTANKEGLFGNIETTGYITVGTSTSAAPNNSFYVEGGVLKFKDNAGTVKIVNLT